MLGPAKSGKLRFEGFKFFAKEVMPGVHHTVVGGIKLLFEFEVGGFKLQKR
jgi:hypothetical protein